MKTLFVIATIFISLIFFLPSQAASFNPITYTGVNLSGAEYNNTNPNAKVNFDYTYPNQAEITYYVSKGANVFRLPIAWERIQPTLNGPLNPNELALLQSTVAMIKYSGATVIIDIHNYGNFKGQAIGSTSVPATAFVNLWSRLSAVYASDKQVAFGLMNEPASQNITNWRPIIDSTIAAIRANNANNLILIPGAGWDGAHDFTSANAAGLIGIKDPANNFMIEMHEYMDSNFSGTGSTCMAPTDVVNNLMAATAWLRTNHYKGFIGEFGSSVDSNCLNGMQSMLTYFASNDDVWGGWTYWAGGPWWGTYFQSIEPANGVDKPQMGVVKLFLQK